MDRNPLLWVALAAALAGSGCASLPADRGVGDVGALIGARAGTGLAGAIGAPDDAATSARLAALIAEPFDADAAMRIALVNNPRMRQAYARLGIAQADLFDAARIPNPTFAFTDLHPRGGGTPQITRILGIDFAALLTLSPRRRLAAAELERVKSELAGAALALAVEAEVAWYGYVGACQAAQMRAQVARAAGTAAGFAQRFYDAGNIDALELALEHAAATQARLDAVRADAAMLTARAGLAALLGLPTAAAWQVDDRLPALPAQDPGFDGLADTALAQRLDLAALRQELALLEDGAGVTRRWRWLGAFELGYERESETDGATLRGPAAALSVPLFNQGQGAVARANAHVEDAQARVAAAELGARNEIALGLDRLATARAIVERYRDALLPQREAVVARMQEQVNYMFKGVFELIAVRREQYDAYEAYLEAVRDYWTARAELRRAAGGRLPDDGQPREPALGVDDIFDAPKQAAPEDHQHEHGDAP